MMRRRAVLSLFALAMPLSMLALACSERPRFSHDFEDSAILDDLVWTCKTLYRLSPENATSGMQSLEVTFFPTASDERENYPGLTLPAFDPDWTRQQTLVFDAYNPEEKVLRLTLRIDDRKAATYAERFNRTIPISPGANRISMPLAGMVTSGSRRQLNLANILRVSLFMANPPERHTLYLDRLRLE